MSDPDLDLDVLDRIQRRVLWLAVRMVDHANHERPNPDGVKVGGHQASSASMVSLMTALWFGHLDRGDRVSVKPHASPVLHAVNYLLGRLDRRYLTTLRAAGGLQAYPSRTKDPDPVDWSTGSVGLGAAAPLFAAAVKRYLDARAEREPGRERFVALVGDAELDEGNVWEAMADPATAGLGNVLWVVDLNRQSLDRVVPGIKGAQLQRVFADHGWQVLEAKYGKLLQAAFAREGGDALRRRIDEMSNEEYQSLFGLQGAELRDRFLAGADAAVKATIADVPDDELAPLLQNLGGHDLSQLLDAYAAADAATDQPSVLFAYTVKGWGLPIAGDPLNHAALLSRDQVDRVREATGLTRDDEWDRFPDGSPEAEWCRRVAERLTPPAPRPVAPVPVPRQVGLGPVRKPLSTQEAFGRLLVGLGRDAEVGPRLVTTSPDVSVSTNLGGWINKVGVFAPRDLPDWLGEGRLLRWRESPRGQHIELGISEMNLFLLLGQLGLSAELFGEQLFPVGTLYDPFVCRGLDAFIYGLYSGSRFVVVGTPAGVTLSYEGGAHQSTITPSIGLELPGVALVEPAYAGALDWLLCDGLARVADREHGESLYLRLTTRPLDQAPFEAARQRMGDDALRAAVLAGGYRLVDASGGDDPVDGAGGRPVVHLFGSGAVLPEVLAAAEELAGEGVAANVVDVTSLDRLYRGWRDAVRGAVRGGARPADGFHLATLLPPGERRAPVVTVQDGASHAMAWIGSVFGAPTVAAGVDGFGQSGPRGHLYELHGLDTGAVVNAALVALEQASGG